MDAILSELYIQIVFATRRRQEPIDELHRKHLEHHIRHVITRSGTRLLALHCHTDHVHLLIRWNPALSVTELVHAVKASSIRYLERQPGHARRLEWQRGFFAFSHSLCDVERVTRFIRNQPVRHATLSFQSELSRMLGSHTMDPDKRYLLEWYS